MLLAQHGLPPDYVLGLSEAALNSHLSALVALKGGQPGEKTRIVNAKRKRKQT